MKEGTREMIREKTHRLLGHVEALALGLLLAVLMSVSIMLAPGPAHAAGQTFTVNNTGDPVEGDPEFGVCNVNFCTLRTAIIAANNHPGEDTIEFNIARPDLRHITPTEELPAITEAVVIDGYSQLFSRPNTKPVGNDASVLVQLVGLQAGNAADGLIINADGVTVRGLAIRDFDTGSGIKIKGSAPIPSAGETARATRMASSSSTARTTPWGATPRRRATSSPATTGTA
jgi:hypothetical protein